MQHYSWIREWTCDLFNSLRSVQYFMCVRWNVALNFIIISKISWLLAQSSRPCTAQSVSCCSAQCCVQWERCNFKWKTGARCTERPQAWLLSSRAEGVRVRGGRVNGEMKSRRKDSETRWYFGLIRVKVCGECLLSRLANIVVIFWVIFPLDAWGLCCRATWQSVINSDPNKVFLIWLCAAL